MARRTQTYAIRLAVEGGGQVKAELVAVGQSGEQSLKRIESAGDKVSGGLKGLGRQAELLRAGVRTLGGALILADLARMTVRQTITAPLAGALQSAFAGGGLFGLFHEGGVAGERPPAMRYADPGIFEHAPRYHGGGFAGFGLLPDEVPTIARRGELVVPPERVVREENTAREQRPITVGSTSPPRTRAPFVRARARSRPTWHARSIGRAGTDSVGHQKHIERRLGGGGAAGQGMGASGKPNPPEPLRVSRFLPSCGPPPPSP